MKNKIVALDSNIFIYQFEKNIHYITETKKIFKKIENGSWHGITSIISLLESLSYPSPQEVLDQIATDFRALPNFTIYDVNQEIALEAARIRREYKIRLPDSIQLATALYGKANIFYTNDVRLKKFPEITVKLLGE